MDHRWTAERADIGCVNNFPLNNNIRRNPSSVFFCANTLQRESFPRKQSIRFFVFFVISTPQLVIDPQFAFQNEASSVWWNNLWLLACKFGCANVGSCGSKSVLWALSARTSSLQNFYKALPEAILLNNCSLFYRAKLLYRGEDFSSPLKLWIIQPNKFD